MTPYSRQWLQDKIQKGGSVSYLFFWGHTSEREEPVGNFIFSQWYPSLFEVEGVAYKTAEHWMMAAKARIFGDLDMLDKIITAGTPKEAKALGRKVRGFVPHVWDEKCYQIVVEGNQHKFSQHPSFGEYLLSTGDQIIVEASPVDTIWGIGLARDSQWAADPDNWRGKNLLGFALMQVRDRLRQQGRTN